jgi:hypothetical protein
MLTFKGGNFSENGNLNKMDLFSACPLHHLMIFSAFLLLDKTHISQP